MAPTQGRIVLYTLGLEDVDRINKNRIAYATVGDRLSSAGCQKHIGGMVEEEDTFPMVITALWGPVVGGGDPQCVNGQVLLDGNDTLWVTSITEGTGPRTWAWPPRV